MLLLWIGIGVIVWYGLGLLGYLLHRSYLVRNHYYWTKEDALKGKVFALFGPIFLFVVLANIICG